jgi:hypothetical protein
MNGWFGKPAVNSPAATLYRLMGSRSGDAREVAFLPQRRTTCGQGAGCVWHNRSPSVN